MNDANVGVERTREISAVLTASIGAIVVLGAMFDWEALLSWVPDLPSTKPITGVVLLLLGLATLLPSSHWLGRSATVTALVLSTVVLGFRLAGRPIHLGGLDTATGTPNGVPFTPTAIGLLVASGAGVLRALGGRARSQALALTSFALGGFALLSMLYGDRSGTVLRSQFPGTAMSVPAAVGLISVSIATLCGTPGHGVVGWFTTDRLGVRTVRRVLPMALAVPLVVAGLASWLDLTRRLGEPRAFAAIAAVMTIAICLVAVRAALVIDQMALVADRARQAEEKLAVAHRYGELARLAEMLAGAATTEDVLSFLAEHVTGPVGGTLGVVGLIDAEQAVLHRHFPPNLSPLEVALGPVPLDQKLPLVVSATTGRSIIVRNRQELVDEFPDAVLAFDAGGFSATAHLPFRDQHGNLFGSLGLAWHDEVVFDDSMFGLLSTVADLAAQTLERAWLSDEQNRAGARAAALALLAESLARSTAVDDVVLAVETHVPAVLASSRARLELLDESPEPEADAESGESETVDPDEIEFGIGEEPSPARRAQIVVRSGEGSPLALVCAEWTDNLPPEARLRSALSTVGDVVGQTLERVRLADAEHRLVVGLQRRALRPLPTMQGLEIAAHYEPASLYLGMGGDWYEGIVQGPHSLGLVVGDVVGHGTDAAIEMLQLSSVLSSLLALGIPLEHLFDSAQEAVGEASIYATAWVGTIDVKEQTMYYVSAGHPPAILLRPGRQPILLDGGRQPMLGVRSADRRSGAVQMPAGSTVVVYTDGLVERRGEAIDLGFDRLIEQCASSEWTSPQALVDGLLHEATEDRSVDDDIAVVAVRVAGRGASESS